VNVLNRLGLLVVLVLLVPVLVVADWWNPVQSPTSFYVSSDSFYTQEVDFDYSAVDATFYGDTSFSTAIKEGARIELGENFVEFEPNKIYYWRLKGDGTLERKELKNKLANAFEYKETGSKIEARLWDSVDVEYILYRGRLKEKITLLPDFVNYIPADAVAIEFDFFFDSDFDLRGVDTSLLKEWQVADGNIDLCFEGECFLKILEPTAFDAVGRDVELTHKFYFEGAGKNHESISVQSFYLRKRSYPIVIDPTVFTTVTNYYSSMAALDDNALAISYYDGATDDGKFVVYDKNGYVITDEVVFNPTDTRYPRVVALDENTLAIAYEDHDVGGVGVFVVYDKNGTQITGETTFEGVNMAEADMTMVALDSNTLAMAFKDDAIDPNGRFVVYDKNGTMILDETVFSGAINSVENRITALDSHTLAIAYNDTSNSNAGTLVVYDKNGEEITGAVVFHADATTKMSITSLDENTVAVAYRDYANGGGIGAFVVYDKNGSVITSETPINSVLALETAIIALDANTIVIAFKDANKSSGYGTFVVYDKNGTAITSETDFGVGVVSYVSASAMDASTFAISYKDAGNSNYGMFTVFGKSGGEIPPLNKHPVVTVIEPSSDGNYLWQSVGIAFDVEDAEGDELNADFYYSTSAGNHTNVLVADVNLNDYYNDTNLFCDSNDWTATRRCVYTWGTTNVLDGNYYLDVVVSDSDNTVEDSSDNDFVVDNSAPFTIVIDYNSGWQGSDQNIILTCGDGWVLSAFTDDGVSVDSIAVTPSGVAFSVDGSKMFVMDYGFEKILQFSLATPWDLSTAVYDDVNVSTQNYSPEGLAVSEDGLKMYELGYTGDLVYQYSLSSAWDLSTAVYDEVSKYVGIGAFSGLYFGADGTRMYVLDMDYDFIYQYNLSTAWDLSTAGARGNSIATQSNGGDEVQFSRDGLQMFEFYNSTVYQYSLTTAWDLSTASYDNITITAPESNIGGAAFSFDGTKLYFGGSNNDKIYQYSIQSSGCSATSYRINGGEWQTFDSSILFATDGNFQLDYRSTDLVGNIESMHTTWVAIDKNAPVVLNLIPVDGNLAVTSRLVSFDVNKVNAGSDINLASISVDLNGVTSGVFDPSTHCSSPLSDGNYSCSYTETGIPFWDSRDYNLVVEAKDIYENFRRQQSWFRFRVFDFNAPPYSTTDLNVTVDQNVAVTSVVDGNWMGDANFWLPLGFQSGSVVVTDKDGNSSVVTVTDRNAVWSADFDVDANYLVSFNGIFAEETGYALVQTAITNYTRYEYTADINVNEGIVSPNKTIILRVPQARLTNWGARASSLDYADVNDSTTGVSYSTSGTDVLISVDSSYGASSLEEGVWEFYYRYYIQTGAPAGGDVPVGGGGAGATPPACMDVNEPCGATSPCCAGLVCVTNDWDNNVCVPLATLYESLSVFDDANFAVRPFEITNSPWEDTLPNYVVVFREPYGIRLTNNSNYEMEISAFFTASDESSMGDASGWCKITGGLSDATLAPRSEKRVTVECIIPEDAEIGRVYATSLVFRNQNNTQRAVSIIIKIGRSPTGSLGRGIAGGFRFVTSPLDYGLICFGEGRHEGGCFYTSNVSIPMGDNEFYSAFTVAHLIFVIAFVLAVFVDVRWLVVSVLIIIYLGAGMMWA